MTGSGLAESRAGCPTTVDLPFILNPMATAWDLKTRSESTGPGQIQFLVAFRYGYILREKAVA